MIMGNITFYLCCGVPTVFLISLYSTPLAQRTSHLALYSSLFRPYGAVNYHYIVTNTINSLLIGSRCIPNGTLTNPLKMYQNYDTHTSSQMVESVLWHCSIHLPLDV